ncbi:MAG: type I-C CRISPR-associated protein Cas8c/Csd1, partial [Acutalibacteraceae bacterium]
MLIKALCDYAQYAAEKSGGNAAMDGWGELEVHFRIMLTPDGDISSIVDLREEVSVPDKKGKEKKKLVPQKIIVPTRTQKPGIESNIIEHRPLYIFGLNFDKGMFTPEDRTNKARKAHDAFVQRQLEFFGDLDSEVCKAYANFVKRWNQNDETENPQLLQLGKDYGTSRFSFGLAGARGNLEEDSQFAEKYNRYYAQQKALQNDNASVDVCGILGEKLPTARLHDKVKFPGGQTMGCQMICMNDTAFESYGKTQSYNSNVSEKAMKMYTGELNRLVNDKKHRVIIDDLVIVYFAMKADDSKECDLMSTLMGDVGDKTNEMLDSVMNKVSGGIVGDLSAFGIDTGVTYYVAGMTPNASRICQKFICRDKFGKIIENLLLHQKDLAINPDNKRQIYFSRIRRELISPKSTNDKVPPPLMTSIILAALNGTKYPRAMLETVVRRVKTDSDDDKPPFIK